jgi:predicted nucleic acid-binding protein
VYVLDTNVISELRRPHPQGAVLAWLGTVADGDLHVASVTIGEIQTGIERTRRQDRAKAAELEDWLTEVVATYNILAMDDNAFRLWAKLMVGKPNTLIFDAMIAAAALANRMVVVTRNIRDFQSLGVATLNPFATAH